MRNGEQKTANSEKCENKRVNNFPFGWIILQTPGNLSATLEIFFIPIGCWENYAAIHLDTSTNVCTILYRIIMPNAFPFWTHFPNPFSNHSLQNYHFAKNVRTRTTIIAIKCQRKVLGPIYKSLLPELQRSWKFLVNCSLLFSSSTSPLTQ